MILDLLTSFDAHSGLLLQVGDGNDDFPAALGFFLAFASVGFFAALSVIAWQLASTYRARMSVAREEGYKEMAHKTTIAMERTASRLDEQSVTLSQLQGRVAEIERLLKDVG